MIITNKPGNSLFALLDQKLSKLILPFFEYSPSNKNVIKNPLSAKNISAPTKPPLNPKPVWNAHPEMIAIALKPSKSFR